MEETDDEIARWWLPVIVGYACLILVANMCYVIYERYMMTKKKMVQKLSDEGVTLPVVKWPLEPEHPFSYHRREHTALTRTKTSGTKTSGTIDKTQKSRSKT